jgi:hypothetical protein
MRTENGDLGKSLEKDRKKRKKAQKKPHPCKRRKDGPPKFKGNVTSNVKGKFKSRFKGGFKGTASKAQLLTPSFDLPIAILLE